jgi:hypothetical protein
MSELLAPLLSLNPDLSDIVSVVELNWYSEVFGFWALFTVGNFKKTRKKFRKLGPFPSSGEGRETPNLLGSLLTDNSCQSQSHISRSQ